MPELWGLARRPRPHRNSLLPRHAELVSNADRLSGNLVLERSFECGIFISFYRK
jgi:hypothetical protein